MTENTTMAAERYYTSSRGGQLDIPRDATHVSFDESVKVISRCFGRHPYVVEVYCHAGVKSIEQGAFYSHSSLKRLIIPGVQVVGENAFEECSELTDVECPQLERIERNAFCDCEDLGSINLPSAKILERCAFWGCNNAMTEAKFGKNLESIGPRAFKSCRSLERITIPLKNGLFTADDVFQGCVDLNRVELIEGAALDKTIDALNYEEWRNDMNEEMDSINQILPDAPAGSSYWSNEVGEKTRTIRAWITRVLRKVIDYKAQHRELLSEAASALQLVLPNDIVLNDVLPFLELPLHTFDGEDEDGEESINSSDDGDEYTVDDDDDDLSAAFSGEENAVDE